MALRAHLRHASVFWLLLAFSACAHTRKERNPAERAEPAQDYDYSQVFSNWPLSIQRLSNGVTVLYLSDASSPVVSYSTWVHAGSAEEEKGATGLAHLFEHLMFKGTKRFPDKPFFRMVEAKGGLVNAYTQQEATVYYEVIPKHLLKSVIEIEADRLGAMSIGAKELEAERKVVLQEKHLRVESDARAQALERLNALLFGDHPYGRPVIGLSEDIEALSLERCRGFFREHYAPSNVLVLIAGAFDLGETQAWVADRYGKIPDRRRKKTARPAERPAPLLAATETLRKGVVSESALIGLRAPSMFSEDEQAFSMSSWYLFNMASSPVVQGMVRERQIAISVSGGESLLKEAGSFLISVEMRDGVPAERGVEALDEILKESAENMPPGEILENFKRKMIYGLLNEGKSAIGISDWFGSGMFYWNDAWHVRDVFKKYQSLTSADLQKAIKKYFLAGNRVIVYLKPKGKAL